MLTQYANDYLGVLRDQWLGRVAMHAFKPGSKMRDNACTDFLAGALCSLRAQGLPDDNELIQAVGIKLAFTAMRGHDFFDGVPRVAIKAKLGKPMPAFAKPVAGRAY